MRNHGCLRTSSFVFFLTFIGFLVTPINRPAIAQTGPMLADCPVFPADNVWNTPIDHLPVHPNSSAYVNTIGATRGVHPDFGSGLWDGGPIGIPYNVVSGTQPKVAIAFDYEDESDSGPYPIPSDAAIEGGSDSSGDRHVLVLDKDNCILYELFSAYPQPGGSWAAGSGAVFDLRSNALRPNGWTSADAAGLPILPGLARYDEVVFGEIRHALRFTAPQTKREFLWPARHYASSVTGADYPPMGQRFRLKGGFDISGFSPEVRTILRALKKYGMILADNGSAWYVSGIPDSRWNNDALVGELAQVKGSDFEAVDETSLMVNPDSAQAFQQEETETVKFVKQQYRDFLNREADAGGLAYWANLIDSGAMTKAEAIESFFWSAEFGQKIAPIVRLYFAYFLRIPDYDGLMFWINNGWPLGDISDFFAGASEFQQRYGSLSNEQFVTLVYQNVLGRLPDPGGYVFWVGQLNTGPMMRGQVMIGFSESGEYKATMANEVYVTMMYIGMLRRSPDPAGFNFWVGYLDSGNSGLALINGFLSSPEYANRFLQAGDGSK